MKKRVCGNCKFMEVQIEDGENKHYCNKKYLRYGTKKYIPSYNLDFECPAHHSVNIEEMRYQRPNKLLKDDGMHCQLCGRPIARPIGHEKSQLTEITYNGEKAVCCDYCLEDEGVEIK